jgi:hypothetical protein
MTKRELIEALADVPDSAEIRASDDRLITSVTLQRCGPADAVIAVWLEDTPAGLARVDDTAPAAGGAR